MGLFDSYSAKAFDYYYRHSDRDNFFILSDVNAKFMKKHNLAGSVKDFKDKVRKSEPFTRVLTGSAGYNFRSTPLYRITDFQNKKNK